MVQLFCAVAACDQGGARRGLMRAKFDACASLAYEIPQRAPFQKGALAAANYPGRADMVRGRMALIPVAVPDTVPANPCARTGPDHTKLDIAQ